MNKIKLEVLSPVHVGSGNFLRYNTDFVKYQDGNDSYLYIIDPHKILNLIGTEKLDDWVRLIERDEDTVSFLKTVGNKALPPKYSSRRLLNFAKDIKLNDTLKECIHDGLGKAYIPGSSIKGAIRTAVLTSLVDDTPSLADLAIASRNGRTNISAKQVEAKCFGRDPQSNIFRFLKVGDAYFEEDCECSFRLINLNIRQNSNLIDRSKSQIVEAILPESETVFQLKLDVDYYKWIQMETQDNSVIGHLPNGMSSLSSLFDLVNKHTRRLVNDELDYWKEVSNNNYSGADNYLESLEYILEKIEACKDGKECVLRLGHASGWRFITGAWAENMNRFNDIVVPSARPNNHKYKEYDFPKSRRLDEDGDILGFVKLSIL